MLESHVFEVLEQIGHSFAFAVCKSGLVETISGSAYDAVSLQTLDLSNLEVPLQHAERVFPISRK